MRRRVLVTGAGSGIGLATVLHLAELGFEVTALVADAGERRNLAEETGRRSVRAEVLEADLSDPGARAGLATDLGLWALVNNAGYMNAGLLRDVPLEAGRRQLEAMVLAPLDLARQALPGMVARGQGRILNVTSSASHAETPVSGWYQASKAALRALNDALRLEVRGTGVDVVDVEPGGVSTNIWPRAKDELAERRAGSRWPEAYDRVLRRLDGLEQRASDPEVVAAAIARALTVGRPRRHIRVALGATLVRSASELVPDAISDVVVGQLLRRPR